MDELNGQLPGKKPQVALPPPEEEMSTEVLLRQERRKRVVSYIREKPQESSRLLKVWLSEE